MKTKKLSKKAKIAIICVSVLAVLIALFFFFSYFSISPKLYSLDKHIERISKGIEKKYMTTGKYVDYEIHPVYNASDELEYFVVDFVPYGYLYVYVRKYNPFLKPFGGGGMYLVDDCESEQKWQRYKVCIDGEEPPAYQGIQWQPSLNTGKANFRYEVDENGNFVYQRCSQFKAANIRDEKRYLLDVYQNGRPGYIPAVKRGDRYLNLISMEEIDYEPKTSVVKFSYCDMLFLVYFSLF